MTTQCGQQQNISCAPPEGKINRQVQREHRPWELVEYGPRGGRGHPHRAATVISVQALPVDVARLARTRSVRAHAIERSEARKPARASLKDLDQFPDPLFRIRLGLGLELKHHVREPQNKRAWSGTVVQPNAPAHDSCRCLLSANAQSLESLSLKWKL